MVGKSQIKLIKSLQQKKVRSQQQLFVVEGRKTVEELINSTIKTNKIYTTNPEFALAYNTISELISSADLKKISSLATPNGYLGVFEIPKPKKINFDDWIVALDFVQDPGNLGTIIRLCDWFGVQSLVCSTDTVDCYNPKVLQATMGSISRINMVYVDLPEFLETTNLPIFGAFMEGEVVYKAKLPKKGILVMGNEANGVSDKVLNVINQKISIPQFGEKTTESLNVATATAILLNEIRRA